jgi:hypothetical protein
VRLVISEEMTHTRFRLYKDFIQPISLFLKEKNIEETLFMGQPVKIPKSLFTKKEPFF